MTGPPVVRVLRGAPDDVELAALLVALGALAAERAAAAARVAPVVPLRYWRSAPEDVARTRGPLTWRRAA